MTGHINVWGVAVFAFLLGLVNAIDTPARQSLIIEMVGKEHLPSSMISTSTFFDCRFFMWM
jgi:hypothetical protein